MIGRYILFVLGFCCLQHTTSGQINQLRKDFIEQDDFGIRKRPITNRDYLIFLCWNINVYGSAFPDYVARLIPESESFYPDPIVVRRLNTRLFYSTDSIFGDYILNPKFIDYPLTGIDQYQLSELLIWLSNRYNENLLWKLGYLNFTPDQKKSDCFVLEAYLTNQFTGSTKNGKLLTWKDNLFLPAFRLPTESELRFLELNQKNDLKIKKYKFSKKDFLKLWNDYYLSEEKGVLTITIPNILEVNFERKDNVTPGKFFDFRDLEFAHENSVNGLIPLRYFDEAGFEVKDEYGMLSFVIVGENSFDRPVVADRKLWNVNGESDKKIFRIAYNKVLPWKYWPNNNE